MMKKLFLIIFFWLIALGLFAQRPIMELTYTAVDSITWVQLDSIKVMNRTQGGDTVLYYPDTVLVLDYTVGIPEKMDKQGKFGVLQCYPNPSIDQTTITMYIPQKDRVNITVTDILGRVLLRSECILEQGIHKFCLTIGDGSLCFFTAFWNGYSSSVEIVKGNMLTGNSWALEHLGSEQNVKPLKVLEKTQSFQFSLGDELLYIGYNDTLQSGMLNAPNTSTIYTFQFATNIPCPGTPTVTYEGQVYNTIQIFSQCWLKENLNVGNMIPSIYQQMDNGIIEKYCYENEPDSCSKYGGLYQWHEMMQYSAQQGIQGICPHGWHIPTDEDWKVLEGAVDSHYGIGDTIWSNTELRGFDAGKNLKTSSGWDNGGNGLDTFSFAAMPGGMIDSYSHDPFAVGIYGYWWSSSKLILYVSWLRIMDYRYDGAHRFGMGFSTKSGLSVRCLMDN